MQSKKFLSVLLALLMMAGVIAAAPVTAHAAETSVGNETALLSALSAAADGDTIKLTADITCNTTIELPGNEITVYIDLHSFTLEAAAGVNLEGYSKQLLLVDPDNGEFNVTGRMAYYVGVNVSTYCKAEVSNITIGGGWGVMAYLGEVVVFGDITTAGGSGVTIGSGSTVTVEGAITYGQAFIQFEGGAWLDPEDFVTPSTKAGYLTYTDGTNSIWVKCADHAFGASWNSNATGHWLDACSLCGAADTPAAHTPGTWIEDTAATYTAPGSQHKECTVCEYVTETGTIPATGVAPNITGPMELKLLAGYAATSTTAYTLTGTPAPGVTLNNNHGGKITWDATNKKLNIGAGLAAGEYEVKLTAGNGVGTAKELTFKLTVAKTIFSTKYEATTWNWIMFFVLFGFVWMWFI